MGANIIGVDTTCPIDILDSGEIHDEYTINGDDPTPEGVYAISARLSPAGYGFAVTGTPTELRDWLRRAEQELDRRVLDDQAATGTAGACKYCTAKGGQPCVSKYCPGSDQNPSGEL